MGLYFQTLQTYLMINTSGTLNIRQRLISMLLESSHQQQRLRLLLINEGIAIFQYFVIYHHGAVATSCFGMGSS